MIKRLLVTAVSICSVLFLSAQISFIEIPPIVISPKLIINSTNGQLSSFKPRIPDTAVSFSTNGPYIYSKSYVNVNSTIKNLCPRSIIDLYPDTQRPLLTTYQWYKCVATVSSTKILSGSSSYTWGDWVAVDTTRIHDVSTATDFATKLFSPKVLHVAYFCKKTTRSLLSKSVTVTYTGLTAISRADAPTFNNFIVQSASVCPGADIVVDPDFDVDGDGLNIYWQQQAEANPSVWSPLSGSVAPFSFPSFTYLNGTYDYRLAISNSCGTTYATSLRDMPIVVSAAYNESYASLTSNQLTKTTCVGLPAIFELSVVGTNSFHTYSYSWEYKPSSSAVWTKITSDNAIYKGTNTLSLSVTPPDTTYQNMQFRCTTVGACKTIISSALTLKVQAVPQIASLTSSQNPACQSTSVTFTPSVKSSAYVSSTEYRWWVNDNVVSAFSPSATSYVYAFSNAAVSVKCEVRANNACAEFSTSKTLSVPVYSNPDVTINVSKSGCGGSTATLIPNFTTTSKAPYTYSWALPGGATSTATYLTGRAAGNRYYLTVTDACTKRDTTSVYVSTFPALSLVCTKTDVLCNSQSNGKITATVAGGVTPYDVKITKVGSATSVLNLTDTTYSEFSVANLPAGEYTVLITDFCNATQTTTVSVNQPAQLVASVIRTKQVTCNAGGDGEAELSVIGGTEPYSVNWSNGVRTKTNVGLFAGTYLANITDNNGCFTSTQTIITQPEKLSVSINKTNAKCYGATDGAIDLVITGGALPINSYIITPENKTLTGTSFAKLKAGQYNIVVTDKCGVSFKESVTISQPEALKITISSTNVSCANAKDGSASLTISGGVSPYITGWSTKDSVLAISGLDSAYYSVSVKDQCVTVTGGVQISKPDTLKATVTSNNISCNGILDGSATVVVQGGTYPYTYSWNNGSTDATIENLSKGKYSVLVSDARGCSKFQSVTIAEPEKVQATVSAIQAADCFGKATGSITVTASKGVPEYSYKWTNAVSSSDKAEKLAQGIYSVTVTDFCKDSVVLSATVSQPASLAVETSVIPVRCKDDKNGSITLIATGVIGSYTYKINGVPITSKTINQIGAGTYTYAVSDACGQTITGNLTLDNPTELNPTVTSTNITCNGLQNGAASVSVSGGEAPYSYNWNNGKTDATIENLNKGKFTVMVSDARACVKQQSAIISEPEKLEAVISSTINNTCYGKANGSITVTASKGVANYLYKWSDAVSVGNKAINLKAGTYSVTVADFCKDSVVLSATVSQPASLAVETSVIPVRCKDDKNGSITLVATGGVGLYTYKINGASITSKTINQIGAGTYTYAVSDACGQAITGNLTLDNPAVLNPTVTGTNITCNGLQNGAATVTVSGGEAPYSYNWNNGKTVATIENLNKGKFTVMVSDARACVKQQSAIITEPEKLEAVISSTINNTCYGKANGSITVTASKGVANYSYKWSDAASVDNKASDLKAGIHFVTVTDYCKDSVVLSAEVTQPIGLSVIPQVNPLQCADGQNASIRLVASGGQPNYTYYWNDSKTAGLQSLGNLASGTYKYAVTDNCGQTVEGSATVTNPEPMVIGIKSTDMTCSNNANGTVKVSVSGGLAPYSYNWNNGRTTDSINSLPKGKYTVQVSDALGCVKFLSATVQAPEELSAVISEKQNLKCNSEAIGVLAVTASKGSTNYSYKWSNDATTAKIENLKADLYAVTVTDEECGDNVVLQSQITEPSKLAVDVASIEPRCNGEKTGSIALMPSGGVGTYHYKWSVENAGDIRMLKQLGAGTYAYTVTDDCSSIESSIEFKTNGLISVVEKKLDASCENAHDGWIALKPQNGTEPYIISWSFGAVNDSIGGLFPGLYSYSLHDANGCTASGTIEIAKPTALEVTAVGGSTACKQTTGTALATASGGTAPYSFKWNNETTDAKVSGLASGLYTVTVTDSKGCTAQTSATIGVSIKQYPICMVTVDSSGKANKIIWEKDNNPTVDSVRIYCFYGTYRKIGQVSASAEYSVYNDYMAKPRQTSYQYAISTLDKCGNESPLSYSHSTMLLWSNFSTEPNKANIEWTPYIDESGAFVPAKYYIYKGNSYMDMDLIDSVPGSSSIYIDQKNDGARYYRVLFKKTSCIVTGLKSDTGPFSQSLSNMSEASLVDLQDTENADDMEVSLAPNPTKGIVTINFAHLKAASLTLVDLLGHQLISTQGTGSVTIDCSAYAAGMYLLNVTINGETTTHPLMIEK